MHHSGLTGADKPQTTILKIVNMDIDRHGEYKKSYLETQAQQTPMTG